MSEFVDVWQMNNILGNLQVEEGTYHQYTSSQKGRTNREDEKYVEIIEEPLSDGYRFRYENELRNAGPIKGVNSKDGYNTHPTIKIHGYRGPARIYVSLITIHGPPYYPHPHNLVGEDCKGGIFRKQIDVSEMPYCFSDLRIQCVKKKKKEVEESLKERERRRIDPFGTGFSHSSDLNKINFNAVRLCFQVLLPDSNGNFEYPVLLNPEISKPIYDSKSASNMSIMKLSHCSASVEGKKEIILLCGQVDKDDIEIIFYEEKDKEIIWTGYGEFLPHDVHYRVAISFRTPAYKTLNVHKQIDCFIYLRRKSDGTIGRPRAFTLLPTEKDSEGIPSKRRKFHDSPTRKDFQSSNLCSPKPDDINLRVKKGEFEIRRNNEKVHCTPRTIPTTVRKDAIHNNVESTPGDMQNQLRKESTHENVESTPRAMQNPLRKEITYENVESTPRAMKNPLRKKIAYENVQSTRRAMQNPLGKEITYENVESTPRAMKNPLRKKIAYESVQSTRRAMQNPLGKEITYENVDITSKSILSPIRESSLRAETSYDTGAVNKFNVRCNPGSTFNPLPSTSALGNESYAQNGPLICDNPEKHASAMSQDQFVGASSLGKDSYAQNGPLVSDNREKHTSAMSQDQFVGASALGKDSYAQNGPLVSDNPEKHASAMSQDQLVGASSLGLPLNTQQLGDHVYPPDFENIQLNKAIPFGDPRENDKLKMLRKDVDPNPNYSNENASSSHLNSDDVFNGFTDLFDFLYGISVDEQIENNLGVLPNSDTADSIDDEQMADSIDDEQMSFQNNVGVLQDNDAEDSADDFLDRLSGLSLEPNSEDPDVTMRDAANNSFSEAVGISILVSS